MLRPVCFWDIIFSSLTKGNVMKKRNLPFVTLTPPATDDGALMRFARDLATLMREAEKAGIVLTIDLRSVEPFAMGNYRMQGNVRRAR